MSLAKTLSTYVGALTTVVAIVVVAVTANNMSPDAATRELRIKSEAQYQKCVIELWPIVSAANPYDDTGRDPITGRSFQEAYLHTLQDRVTEMCSARGVR